MSLRSRNGIWLGSNVHDREIRVLSAVETSRNQPTQMKDKYFTILRDSFPKPPTQTAVGRVPVEYLKAVNGGDHSTRLLSLLDGQFRRLRRSRVHEICRDENIPVLEAYAVAMAWGGQHPVHFSSSIEEPSRSRLERMLHELRNSRNHREKDFEVVQSACTRIRGLGISFFSKLLFFFRPDPDAFILDQWTAKSMDLLFEDPPVSVSRFGFPAPDTSPIQYDLFEVLSEVVDGRAAKSAS